MHHTGRLVLRRPTRDDAEAVFRIHGDPRTNVHNPAGPHRSLAESRDLLAEWLRHWAEHGFGYWVVELRDPAERVGDGAVGFCGVRHEVWRQRPVLNLYYRFAPESWGRGIAGEAARYAVEWAGASHPGRPVLARTTADNIGSQRTAGAAGLARRPDLDDVDADGIPSVILVSHWE